MQENSYSNGSLEHSSEEFRISNFTKNYLSGSAKWAQFIAIVGFIGAAGLLVLGLTATIWTSRLTGMDQTTTNPGAIGMAITYLAMALIQFFMALYLYRFALATRQALATADSAQITKAFKNLKNYFQINGIIMIIALIFIFLAALIGTIAGVSSISG
ncbi:MAG: DUF5362 family protein [Rikenellaceae bacterium]|nr:DUF5362 family protein [Rikenellaceae bacterium]